MTEIGKGPDKQETDIRVRKAIIKDTAAASRITQPLIMLFEIAMIIGWIFNKDMFGTPLLQLGYLASYCFLLTFTILVYVCNRNWNLEEHLNALFVLQTAYVLVMVLWSLIITYFENMQGLYFPLTYIACITLIPIISHPGKGFVITLQVVGSVTVAVIEKLYNPHFLEFMIDFTVYAFISIIASEIYRRNRQRNYERQVELEDISRIQWEHANLDSLTGLGSRRAYLDKLEALDQLGDISHVAVYMLDLNDLKKINDTQGHVAGDEIIKGAADSIRKTFDKTNAIYRIGGDEFAIICETGCDPKEMLVKLDHITSEWRGQMVDHLSISRGWIRASEYPGRTMEELMILADQMMYRNKEKYHARQRAEAQAETEGSEEA